MQKRINNLDLSKIEEIIIEDDNVMNITFSEDGKQMILFSNIKPEIIDENFNELDDRVTELESIIKLRLTGQINNILSRLENL